jgi:hypothetical protein
MPEDEGKNGDRWTEEAARLLRRLGWEKIADSNIDIPGSDGYMHGIDALFRYEDGYKFQQMQGVFLEAKRYETSSFRGAKLRDWVERLDEKILQLRMSEEFYTWYPAMKETTPKNGLLVLWFHDLDNYSSFKSTFRRALSSVETPRRRQGSRAINRLFILENDGILRLCSVLAAMKDWNREQRRADGLDTTLKYFYPSSLDLGNPVQEMSVLNLEFIFSSFITAKALVFEGTVRTADVVFYFGQLDIQSFHRLRQALLSFNMLSSSNLLYIYLYQRDDNFRKIEPDVRRLFSEGERLGVTLKTMEKFGDLPSWLKDDEAEQ